MQARCGPMRSEIVQQGAYLVQHKVGMYIVCCNVGGAARAALLVDQVRGDALEAEAVAALGNERVSEHAHAYGTSKVVLSETEQGRGTRLGHRG